MPTRSSRLLAIAEYAYADTHLTRVSTFQCPCAISRPAPNGATRRHCDLVYSLSHHGQYQSGANIQFLVV